MKKNSILLLLLSFCFCECESRFDCTKGEFLNNVASYDQGYTYGFAEAKNGGSMPCETFADEYNHHAGATVIFPTACFCSGYDDAFGQKPNAYKKN